MADPWAQPSAYLVRQPQSPDNNFLIDEGVQAAEAIQNYFSWGRVGRVIVADSPAARQTAEYIMESGNVADPLVVTYYDLDDTRLLHHIRTQFDELPSVIVLSPDNLPEIDGICQVADGGILAVYLDSEGQMTMVPRLGEIAAEVSQ